ncbi:MAG TPA: helix-hairpin-helix domain-containing protein [Armatimonadota bacterium]|nr:helix-hairpin-helix domain-containing protein [Armatimonadota bacterium]
MFNFTRNQLIAAGIIVAIGFIGTAVLVAKSGVFSPGGGDIKFIESGAPAAESTDQPAEPPQTVCVHVTGKVSKPGVYDLKPGSRVTDAIKEAGGALPNSDLESINLAEKLTDGQQVYIAPKGQIAPPKVSIVRGGAAASPSAGAASESVRSSGPKKLTRPGEGTVHINTAGFEELQRLPGIGPAMAQRIVDYRTEHGRFQSIEELDEVRGIGPAKLEKMRPFVTL